MTKHSVFAGFAVAAIVALGSLGLVTDRHLRLNADAEARDGVSEVDALRPGDEVVWRILRLTESLEQSRAAAERNPLLLADVGYYEAELAVGRRQSATVR